MMADVRHFGTLVELYYINPEILFQQIFFPCESSNRLFLFHLLIWVNLQIFEEKQMQIFELLSRAWLNIHRFRQIHIFIHLKVGCTKR